MLYAPRDDRKMTKYKKCFMESWEEINDSFVPHNKRDIINIISHSCLNKLADPQINISSTDNYDLVLTKHSGRSSEHCLIANFQLVDSETKQNWLNEARNNISLLKRQSNSTVRRIYAIFDNTDSISLREINDLEILGSSLKPYVEILFNISRK